MGLYSGGLNIRRIFASEIWGAYFRRAYFGGGLLSELYGILITLFHTQNAPKYQPYQYVTIIHRR